MPYNLLFDPLEAEEDVQKISQIQGSLHFSEKEISEMATRMDAFIAASSTIGTTTIKWSWPFSRHFKKAHYDLFKKEPVSVQAFKKIDKIEKKSYWLQFIMRCATLVFFLQACLLFIGSSLVFLDKSIIAPNGNDEIILVESLALLYYKGLTFIPNAIGSEFGLPPHSEFTSGTLSQILFVVGLIPLYLGLLSIRTMIRHSFFAKTDNLTIDLGASVGGFFTQIYDTMSSLLEDSHNESGKDWLARAAKNVSLAFYQNERSDYLDRYLTAVGWRSIDAANRIRNSFSVLNFLLSAFSVFIVLNNLIGSGISTELTVKFIATSLIFLVLVYYWTIILLRRSDIWIDKVVKATETATAERPDFYSRIEKLIYINKQSIQKGRFIRDSSDPD